MLRRARRLPPPPAHSSNPLLASPAGYTASRVWAPPRSLAATKGILSVPRGTEMFQFPRCPLGDRSPSARPCAGRVAPFGHPRIAGCQRLPGAFRRVAASFLGRQRQGIHHAPILRISCAVSPPRSVVTATADRHAPAGWSRLAAPPAPSTRRLVGFGVCVCVSVCLCVCCCAVRAGEQTRARLLLLLPGRADGSDRARPPSGLASSRGRRTRRVPRGALSRCRRPEGLPRPAGRQTHRSSRSSNLVRSRAPTSEEISQPAGARVERGWRHAGVATGGPGDEPSHRGRPPRASPAPGGAAGIRTPDLRRARAALSQLSYGPAIAPLLPRAHGRQHGVTAGRDGWARLDSNQGPRPYQGRALTT